MTEINYAKLDADFATTNYGDGSCLDELQATKSDHEAEENGIKGHK